MKKFMLAMVLTMTTLGVTACGSSEVEVTEENVGGKSVDVGDIDEDVVLDETVPPVGSETGGHAPEGEEGMVERPMAGEPEAE